MPTPTPEDIRKAQDIIRALIKKYPPNIAHTSSIIDFDDDCPKKNVNEEIPSALQTALSCLEIVEREQTPYEEIYCKCSNRQVIYSGTLTQVQIDRLPCVLCGKPLTG